MNTEFELERAVADLRSSPIETPPFTEVLRKRRVSRLVATVFAVLGIGAGGASVAAHRYPPDSSVASAPVSTPAIDLATGTGIWPAGSERPTSVEGLADQFAREVLGWRAFQTSFSPNSTSLSPTFVTVQRLDVSVRLLAAPSADNRWAVLQIGDGASFSTGDAGHLVLVPASVPTRAVTAHWYARGIDGPTIEGDTRVLERFSVAVSLDSLVSAVVLFYDDLGQLVGVVGTALR